MKKWVLMILGLLMMLVLAVPAMAQTGEPDAAQNAGTVSAPYTVEFTYDGKQYVMPGDSSVRLSAIMDEIELTGEAEAVSISDTSLFSASNETGEWIVTAHQAFDTTEWMKVTINGVVYEITVTDTTTEPTAVDSTDYALFTGFTATGGNGTNYANLVDGNTSSDWIATKNYDDPNAPANDFAGGTDDPAFVEFHADEAFIPKGYVLTCDNENAGFWKPVQWALKAKLNEGDAWTAIHSSTTTLGHGKTFEIACNNDGDNEYQYFRFEVYEVGTTMTVDLDELQFYGSLPSYTHLTVKAATCTATGIKQDCYRSNSDGKYFTDETGTTELAESAVIAPIISHTGVHHEATDASIEYWQCSMCSKYFSNEGCTTEITEEQTKIYHTITIDASISGLVEVAFSKTQALAGESIILYVDYQVDASTLKVNDGAVELTAKTDIQYTFTMPAADVTVKADVAQSNADGDVLTGSIRHTVTIPDGASITLNNATITGSIVCEGSATITLVGTNSVSGATNKAGIQIGGSGTTLTINGDGTLTANGGDNSAGIGLSRAWNVTEDVVGGNIVINGGNITANGGGGGAGIGAGVTKDPNNSSSRKAIVGTITIAGGSVTAVGGSNADGIGAGKNNYNATIQIGTVTIYDGIDKVDASSIKDFASVVYMHDETNVNANKTDYFAIGENGNRKLIVQKPVIAEIADQTYTGSEITPEPQVKIGSLSLAKGTDYEYSYTNNTNVGTAKVTVTFKGDYASLHSVKKEFHIYKTVSDPTITVAEATYTGNALEPMVTVKDGDTEISSDEYTVSYANNTNAALSTDANPPTVTITDKEGGSYIVNGHTTFTINPKPVTITGLSASEKVYDGTTAATVTGTGTIEDKVGSDDVSVDTSAGTATFDSANVGTGKTVTFSGYALSGESAGNYTLSSQPANVTASITARAITITANDQSVELGGTIAADIDKVSITDTLVSGHSLHSVSIALAEGQNTNNAGEYGGAIVPSGAVIWNASSEDVTANYAITYVNGKLTVTKIKAKVTTAPEPIEGLVYNGQEQALITAGEADTAMEYALGENADTAPTTGYGDTVRSGKDAKSSYYVWYRAKADANHDASEPAVVIASIGKATINSMAVSIGAPAATSALATEATTDTTGVTLNNSGTITWIPAAPQDGKAEYAKTYTATVTAAAAENYTFADTVTATVNGQSANATKNDDGTLTISYTFGKTALNPVTITAADKEVTYSADGIAIPVEGMFTIPEGAGAATYAVENGTGVGTYDAQTGKLTVTKCGIFTIKVSTAESDTHAAGAETTATLTVNKANNPATIAATVSVMKSGNAPELVNTVDLADNVTLNGATGVVNYVISGDANGCTLSDSVLTAGSNTGTVTVNVTVEADDNYMALAVTPITVTITNKQTQTIAAENMTVTYGDTGKSVSASVTEPATGGGAISYAVKDGSTDYIDVDASTGALTIKKAGTATVVVTAAETQTHAAATKEVTVTISTKAMTVSAEDVTVTVDGQPHGITVTVTDPATGATIKYGEAEGTYDLTASPTLTEAGTKTVYYQVTADNYTTYTGSATVTVSTKQTQTITASDVTATYGDTGKSVSASVTDPATGGGAISYVVKSGDAVSVNPTTGALTIVKAGSAVITVTAAETDTYAQATKDVTVTVNTKAMTVSTEDVTVTQDGQPHGVTVNVTDPATGATVKYGTTEGTYDLTASPTQTEAGTLTIYYQVTAENYTTYTGSATVTVSAKQTQTITAEDVTATYGDTGKSVSATTDGDGTLSYAVKSGDAVTVDASSGALTIVKTGTATVTVTASGTATYEQATRDVTVTVNKAASTVTKAPTAKNLIYNGQAQALVTDGTATGGEMQYALGTATEATQPYTTSIPTATDAGTYSVWYKVVGDANHNDSAAVCITVNIAPVYGTPTFTMPSGLKTLGESAFEGMTALSVVDAHTCTSIGKGAFKDSGITQIRLPKDCDIAADAFSGCGTVYVYAPTGGKTETACAQAGNMVFVEE